MRDWVDWVYGRAIKQGHPYLWLGDDQLGDWLALDTQDIMRLKGKTSDDLIASGYYYYSTKLVSRSLAVLGQTEEAARYQKRAAAIKQAFIKHFFTGDGLPVTETQTGLALCLQFDLYPPFAKQLLVKNLVAVIEQAHNHLTTGFVGTPLLLPALSAAVQGDLALRLFLNHDFPSWLYEVDHGATTIWERWDSVGEDGRIADNGMNSLNHYSAGAVMALAYEDLLGVKQELNDVTFAPMVNARLKEVAGQIKLPTGILRASWRVASPTKVTAKLEVPYGSHVTLALPKADQVTVNGRLVPNGVRLGSGIYQLEYQPQAPVVESFDLHTPIQEFAGDEQLTSQLSKLVPFWGFLTLPGNLNNFGPYSLAQLSREMRGIGFQPLDNQQRAQIQQLFNDYAMQKLTTTASV